MSFAEEWERCSPWLQAALDYCPTHSLDDVLVEIASGEAMFWPGKAAAMVTQVVQHPQLKVCSFWLAGGDLDELVNKMRPEVEDWARSQGCERMITPGRFGWARVLKPEGYEPLWAIISKDLHP